MTSTASPTTSETLKEQEEFIKEEKEQLPHNVDEGLCCCNDDLLCARRDDISTDNKANLNNVPALLSARKRIENLSRLLHKFQERLKNPGSAIKSNKKKKKAMQMYEEQMMHDREDDSKDRKGMVISTKTLPGDNFKDTHFKTFNPLPDERG